MIGNHIPRVCWNCQHSDIVAQTDIACGHSKARELDPIFGRAQPCASMREAPEHCGPRAAWFQTRKTQRQPSDAEVAA